jgi:8-oxo-dGTP diphosphatase
MDQLKTAVVGVVNNKGHILIGKKTTYKENDVLSEKWHIPGGGVKENEKISEAVQREINEEFGISVRASRIIDINLIRKPDKFVLVYWIECIPENTEITLSEEISEARWVEKNKVTYSLNRESIELFPPLVHEYFEN